MHLYLIAPGKQGAAFIYQNYIGPLLEEHETQLETIIDSAWSKFTGGGADYLKKA